MLKCDRDATRAFLYSSLGSTCSGHSHDGDDISVLMLTTAVVTGERLDSSRWLLLPSTFLSGNSSSDCYSGMFAYVTSVNTRN